MANYRCHCNPVASPWLNLSEKHMEIPGLRSPYETVGGIVYFGRMLDKIRLNAAGALPPGYQLLLGNSNPGSFDGYCCRFLQIEFAALSAFWGGFLADDVSW